MSTTAYTAPLNGPFIGPFIGRADELARLTRILDRARAGEARAVLVAGDAGVGKTRVLAEAAGYAAAAGTTVITGHCVDLGDVGLPYLPFTEILGVLTGDERFCGTLAAHPVVDRLIGHGGDGARDAGGRPQLFEGLAALLAELTRAAPLLLVLEDLHWADQSSRDLLRFLLSRGVLGGAGSAGGAPGQRLAVFASYRADDLHRRHPLRPLLAELVRLPAVERLELRPMPDGEVARLVRSQRTAPVTDATIRRIVERAEGNAFYAEELLAATSESAPGDASAVPSGLADVLLSRFEQLSPTAQQVLRTAAVAGRRVEHDLLRDAVRLPEEDLESALREAVGRQLLVAGGGPGRERDRSSGGALSEGLGGGPGGISRNGLGGGPGGSARNGLVGGSGGSSRDGLGGNAHASLGGGPDGSSRAGLGGGPGGSPRAGLVGGSGENARDRLGGGPGGSSRDGLGGDFGSSSGGGSRGGSREGAGGDSAYSFRHALIREAVYADLLPGERVRLHRAFAQVLAGRGLPAEYAAERAHHSRESHDLPDALAASLEAADHAARVRAPAEELRHLEAALDLWSAVPADARPDGYDTVTLTLRASAAAAHAGETHRAVSLTRAALAHMGSDEDSELAARVRYTLAGNLMRIDSLTAAFTYSSEALAMIPADPPSRTWVWAASTHVMAARYVGHDETARDVARRALGIAEDLDIPDARADLMISLVGLEGASRTTSEGRARLREARELARRAGNTSIEMRALFNLSIGAYESGDLDECLTWLSDGLERAGRAGLLASPYPLEMRYLRSLVLYSLGQWDACVRAAESDAEGLPAAGRYAIGPALSVALARGEEGAAERARSLLDGPFDWMAALVAGILLTDAAALRHDPEAAVEQVRTSVVALTEDSGTAPDVVVRLAALALAPVADAAVAARQAGDEDGVRRWCETGAELVGMARVTAAEGEDGAPQGPEGRAWLARAEAEWARACAEPDPRAREAREAREETGVARESTQAWEKAVEAFGYGDVYEQARCRVRLAEALVAAGRREEAAGQARVAQDTAVRLGAVPLRADVERLIRRARLAETSPVAGVPALTARENDVLLLLARGRINRQIGEELFISGKTASVHVSNILAKLGAASRTEAVAIAYREGLVEPGPAASG
ncbi:helix-turn-helix transcriptional regulator [Streptomyces sp. DSM 40484]|uniref:helix-turn-helix transcriptional regulator n=1 Tax=Streptomyces kroppenstedtii TaxID=3051181 RepID=UPI0028D011F2|nr:AAA family ATPase [Streptomyces sp. DSM 40484]